MSLFSFLPPAVLSSTEWADNPFRAALMYANRVANPKFPAWASGLLLAFVAMRAIFIITCVGIISIPVFKGSSSRRRHFFLLHRAYADGEGVIPYLVPNRCMIIVIGELFSNVLYLCEAWFTYRYYTEGDSEGGFRRMWLFWLVLHEVFQYFSSYLGIVLSSWGLCYACFCEVPGSKKRPGSRIMSPIFYNFIWITWAVLATIATMYWACRAIQRFSNLQDHLKLMHHVLGYSSTLWEEHHDFKMIPIRLILANSMTLFRDWRKVSSWMTWWGITWIVLGSALLVFYLFVVWVLLTMFKQVLRMREIDSMTVSVAWASPIWVELELEFRFLLRSSFIIALSIGAQIVEAIYQAMASDRLDVPSWRIASVLISQVPGMCMAPALLLQSWHIFTERSKNESQFHRVPMDTKKEPIPQMTSQLLGWDITHYLDEEINFQVANFPGLRPVQSSQSNSQSDSIEHPTPDWKKSDIDISITCLTVITEENAADELAQRYARIA
ncbi:hypothetical protein DFH28DRAFT_885771 [Melampsora americana]|nr:hypothetical protein DFH28DRAFT_885771 [Melampsora americana]